MKFLRTSQGLDFIKETRFILGIFPIKAYVYNWVYTLAQIELILSDRPLVLYKNDNGNKGVNAKVPSANDAQSAYDEWLRKKEESKGKKLKLNDWISNG